MRGGLLTLLGGLSTFAACSSTEPDVVPRPVADAGPSAPPTDSGAATDGATIATCPGETPIPEGALPWKPPPPPQPGKCTSEDITFVRNFIRDQPQSSPEALEDALEARNPGCRACVFTDAALPTWGPAPKADGKLLTINIGACYAVLTASTACGKAVQQEFDCEILACTDVDGDGKSDCTSAIEQDACRSLAQKGNACKATFAAVKPACVGADPSVDKNCGGLTDSMRVLCGTPSDGG